MLFSMNWIGDFVDLSDLDIKAKKALIDRFTLSTAEVEDIYYKGADTHGVIVAKIKSVKDHPSSKKLHLLKVDTGAEIVDCVCGAPNVREGMTVAFATVGGAVSGMEIAAREVAGFPSMGMCCSEAELGLSADNSGLWELPDELAAGTDIKSVYPVDDVIFEVDNKSLTNRPDLWGHYGVAREIAAILGRPLLPVPKRNLSEFAHLPPVDIDIRDTEHAYRYIGVKAENITRHESPAYMRIRLFYCGSRAINFLADLTNYVMMEIGQPMHAFDLRKVDKIEVQRYAKEFTFTTLDHEERTIDNRILMICSHEEPVAIAGIKGGLASGIEDDTTSLLLESATFDGVCIRKASTALGLRTDASMRYEKMLDPHQAAVAAARFLHLLLEIDPEARIISAATDKYVYEYPTIEIDIDKAYYDRYTGIDIPADRICSTLTALGFEVDREGDAFHVTVPSWRATKDVTIKADLIEEVTRIYGYDNFAVNPSLSPIKPVRADRGKTDDNRAKDLLVASYGMHEVHSYIWCDAANYKEMNISLPENPKIINAQTPEHAVLRASLVPTLLHFLTENKGFSDRYGLFEIGRAVQGYAEDGSCLERRKLAIALYDKTADEEEAFLTLRDAVVSIFRSIKHVTPVFVATAEPADYMHPANAYDVTVDGVCYGTLSVPHPGVKGKLDKKAAFAFAEIDMDTFSAMAPVAIKYLAPSRFPDMALDFSFAVDPAAVNFDELCADCHAAENALIAEKKAAQSEKAPEERETVEKLLTAITVADVYKSESESSLTVRFNFSSKTRTLTRAELTPITDAMLAALKEKGIALKD